MAGFRFQEWHVKLGQLLDKGLTYRAAAEKLGISENAVQKAVRLSMDTSRPIGRSVRSRAGDRRAAQGP